MFTVVIPLYNKQKFIRRAVESVLMQDFKDFELIVVNDGSTDDSINKIIDISDNRLTIINQANKGVGFARNVGISSANSDWVALLDADDVWLTNHLSELKNIVNKFPLSGLISTQHLKVDTNLVNSVKNVDSQDRIIRTIDYFFETPKAKGIVWTSAVAIRKDVFKNIGGFNNHKKGEDLEYWIRIALDYPIAISEKITAYYCRGTGGVTESQTHTGFKKIESLSDFSSGISLLINRANDDPLILKSPIIKAYINYTLLTAVKTWVYRENIPAAKNRSKLAIPQCNINFFTLFLVTLTPKIILKKAIDIYKNKSLE